MVPGMLVCSGTALKTSLFALGVMFTINTQKQSDTFLYNGNNGRAVGQTHIKLVVVRRQHPEVQRDIPLS